MKRPVFKILTSAILLLMSSMTLGAEEPVYDLAKFSSVPFHYQVMARDIYNATFDHTRNDFKKRYIRSTDYYFATGMSCGLSNAYHLNVGLHIKKINLELFLNPAKAFNSPRVIYWNNVSESNDSYLTAKYQVLYSLGAKAGYGFNLAERVKITPQMGYRFNKLKEEYEGSYRANFVDGAFSSSITLGARVYYALYSHLGVSVSPEYSLAVSKSKGFKILEDANSKIGGFADGFNISMSLNFVL